MGPPTSAGDLPRPSFSYTSRGQGRAWLENPQQISSLAKYTPEAHTQRIPGRGLSVTLVYCSRGVLRNSSCACVVCVGQCRKCLILGMWSNVPHCSLVSVTLVYVCH